MTTPSSKVGWTVSVIVLVGMVVLAVGGYVIYKYRLRVQFPQCHHFMNLHINCYSRYV
jgi:hypothetical protein